MIQLKSAREIDIMAQGGEILGRNVPRTITAPTVDADVKYALVKDDLSFLVVDRRLATALPAVGVYFERDEPDAYAAWQRGDVGFRFPGGESLAEHVERVGAALDDVDRGPLPALVVCHGGTVRAALVARGERPLGDFQRIPVPNAALVRLEAA
jgi:hypothetical protein